MSAPSPEAPPAAGPTLRRSLGLGLLTFYGVGVMIGAGIYVLIGEVAAAAGAWTPVAFLLAGAAAALTAASYAELSARRPEAGGEAAYADEAFRSEATTLCVGLAIVAVGILSAAAVLQGGVGYLRGVVPVPTTPAVIAIGLALTATAAAGVAGALRFAAVLTVIEIAGLALVVAAAFSVEPAPALEIASAEPSGGGGGLAAAIFLAFFAYIGFEDIVNMAEETRDPVRTVPRAILLAFVIVTAIYVLIAVVALRAVGPEALAASERPLALVAERAVAGGGAVLGAIGVAAALNGVLAQIVMAARVLFGLGRRTRALAWAARVNERFRTPLAATLVCGLIVIALAVAAPVSDLAAATSLVLLTVFVLMNAALIVLKRRDARAPAGRPVHPVAGAPDMPLWIPYLGAAASLAVLLGAAL
ncbi:MAG: APC family permease [Pseudomonadota bacterium]